MNTNLKNNAQDNKFKDDEEAGLTGSKPKNQNLLQEPESHIKMRTFIERCPLFVCSETKNKLTKSEISSFYTLKEEINILYDSNNHAHETLLKDLYKICFMDEHTILLQDEIDIKEDLGANIDEYKK